MRVLTILVRFGTERYPHAEQQVAEIFRRQMPEVERAVVVVDNALPSEFVETDERRTVIGGNNAAREFSAFDRAVEYIGPEIWRYDLVHLATDAFDRLYIDYLARFRTSLLNAVAKRSVCVGHIDCYNQPVEILGFHTQHWIRTGFFFLPPTEVKLLGSFVTVLDRDHRRFFNHSSEAPFRPDAPLSMTYREYIASWLSGRDIGQGVTWHSSFTLTAETLPMFEAKALAIMNEQLLGVRLRAMGCHLIDVTWLSTVLARRRFSSVQWNTEWREQLARRDRHAVTPSALSVASV